MRRASGLGALLLLWSLPDAAFAQGAPDIRQVTVPVLDVRSGPSDSDTFYTTNRLRSGATVEVVREAPNGWLAIRPPEGSFSYINARFLDRITPNQPTNHVVSLPDVDVPVYIGSEVVKDHRPTNIGVHLKRGAQVISIGNTITDPHDGAFMPIEPPPGEVRFILASSVVRAPAGSVFTASHADSATGAGPLQPSNAPSANPPPTPESLWACAQQAECKGQIPEAVRLYDLAAAQAVHSNPNLAKMAWQRAAYLQSGYQTSGAAVTPATATGRAYPLPGEDRSAVRVNPPPGALTTWSRGQTVSTTTARSDGPAAALPPGWISRKGWLRQAGRNIEGQKTYVINSESSYRPLAYVVSAGGVDLASHVGKLIEVQGPAVYLGDIRNNYIKAMRVIPQLP